MKKALSYMLLFLVSLSIISCSKEENSDGIPGDPTAANKKSTGSSSNELLSSTTFTSLIVELAYVEGYKPTQPAINNFKSFLQQHIYKPDGITVQMKTIPSTGNSPYTVQEIIAIEDAHRTQYNSGSKIAVWAFFADGESASNSGSKVVLGSAYRNTSFVIFEETIHGYSDSPLEPDRDVLETTVINHELGHILGLTNLGTALQSNHEDNTHPKHCNVEDCLMYWSAETGDGIANLVSGGVAPQLDAQCMADLKANGGK
ncbi:membrane metalloprotease [Aureibaculum sp. 2210JD6-5]|uniref:membrane metalloprotease n=1 Tax=Aureibaculum sp. 2210JD6-5 TaxID=3103957 RepID=UPI002AAC98C1|nr:membrane metalloprotease [Aureibaculum sp. 2210JD6-5]MDY7393712.1 membrane metalloprotease [Aureibaculum sp. 2210JD6-5]